MQSSKLVYQRVHTYFSHELNQELMQMNLQSWEHLICRSTPDRARVLVTETHLFPRFSSSYEDTWVLTIRLYVVHLLSSVKRERTARALQHVWLPHNSFCSVESLHCISITLPCFFFPACFLKCTMIVALCFVSIQGSCCNLLVSERRLDKLQVVIAVVVGSAVPANSGLDTWT